MLFVRLIALLIYTIAAVHIIRFLDGQYLKEKESLPIIAVANSQKKNEGRLQQVIIIVSIC